MRRLFIVLAKLASVYFLYLTLMQVPTPFDYDSVYEYQRTRGLSLWIFISRWGVTITQAGFCLITAGILAFKTNWLADKLGVPDEPLVPLKADEEILKVGLRLLGFYFAVVAVGNLTYALARLLIAYRSGITMMSNPLDISSIVWQSVVPNVVLLAIGLFALLNIGKLISWLDRASLPPPAAPAPPA
jgi:hypothetical protein